MKKVLSGIILFFMVGVISACGSSSGTESSNAASSSSRAESVISKAEVSEAESEESTEEENVEALEESKQAASGFSQVLVDEDGIKFEIKSVDPDALFGYTWKVYLENNTDKSLMYSISDASVNGIMMDPFWATSVEPGKKKNDEISWSTTSLKENGIDEVTVVEMSVRIYDDEDWMADAFVDEIFTVYPLGESAATNMERVLSDSDIVLFDTDDCAMIVTGFDPDGLFGFTMQVYLENKTDQALMFSIEDASVNGFMADPFWADEVMAKKKSNEDISWSNSTLEENGIEKVDNIEIKIHVYPSEDMYGNYLIDETYTIEP